MDELHCCSRNSILLWLDVCLELSVVLVDVRIVTFWCGLAIGAFFTSSLGTLLES